jgi:transketolase
MDLLNTFQKNGTDLVAHPVMNAAIGIEASSGSLGQGVSMAVGLALAAKKRSYSYNTYAVLGNGECDEGSVWEAAISAVNFELDNLTLIIDDNKMQSDGKTAEIMRTNGLAKMFGGIGCHVVEADGHNIEKLILAINDRQEKLPTVVVANTVKGKGISFMENNNEWHHNRLTEKQYLAALEELKELEKEAQ